MRLIILIHTMPHGFVNVESPVALLRFIKLSNHFWVLRLGLYRNLHHRPSLSFSAPLRCPFPGTSGSLLDCCGLLDGLSFWFARRPRPLFKRFPSFTEPKLVYLRLPMFVVPKTTILTLSASPWLEFPCGATVHSHQRLCRLWS